MQNIAAHSDASFIVIGDKRGVHLFHSVHPEWVGTRLVGGDNQPVLEGKSTTTIRKGDSVFPCAAKRPFSMTRVGSLALSPSATSPAISTASRWQKSSIFSSPRCCCLSRCLSSHGTSPAALRNKFSRWSRAKSACWYVSKSDDGVDIRRGDCD